ncbi:MAG: hypothetical protein O2967_18185 [Proteobacteria bacterium]|nr:hypothetical protein [Pseudomonadota bacterium]
MSLRNIALSAALALPITTASMNSALAMPDFMDVSCLARDTLSNYLDRAYGEGRIAQAELDNGNQVELFVSRQGTWTLVEMMPDGQGCVHAYGRHMKVDGRSLPALRNPAWTANRG